MADGYARACNGPAICMAQSVGAANLAAGLQDPFLGLSPVIAITGHRPLSHQYRNAYQEIDHFKPFSSVTKYSVAVDTVTQLPHLCARLSGKPLPAHPARCTWTLWVFRRGSGKRRGGPGGNH